MHILTYETLDETRQKTLNEVAAKIGQDPNEILSEVPFAIALYGRFINPKVIGGYLKRLVNESGEKLAPDQVIEKQMQEEIDSDPTFGSKAKIALNNWFAKSILKDFGITSINELIDPSTGHIKDLGTFAKLIAANPNEKQQESALDLCRGPELTSIKLELGPEFEALKTTTPSHEETGAEAKLSGAGGGVGEEEAS